MGYNPCTSNKNFNFSYLSSDVVLLSIAAIFVNNIFDDGADVVGQVIVEEGEE
jgi:hypothetical protein